MNEPSEKSEAIEEMIQAVTGRNRNATIRGGKCMTCPDGDAAYFRDEASRREYVISGMCQRCQDKVFGTEE